MQQALLIEKVRQYEFLYDAHATHYRDHNMRHQAWEQIGRDLKMTASQAKDAWSKLRNCFCNALKRRNTKSGQARKKYIPWKYEKQMAFLQAHVDFRTFSYLSQSDNTDEEDECKDIETGEHSMSSSSTFKVENTSSSLYLPQQPRKEHNAAEDMTNIMDMNSDMRMQKPAQETENNIFPNNFNETDMFYLSMSRTIQKLPQWDQVRIRMELCKLVSEAEMDHLQAQTQLSVTQTSATSSLNFDTK